MPTLDTFIYIKFPPDCTQCWVHQTTAQCILYKGIICIMQTVQNLLYISKY